MTLIISSVIVLCLSFLTFFYYKKYSNLKTKVKEYDEIGTGRIGFYISNKGGSYQALVYVYEIDRYTTGYSKIKIKDVESLSPNYKEDSISYAKKRFVTLLQTSDIEWLESEDNIKKLRKEKLEQLKKI